MGEATGSIRGGPNGSLADPVKPLFGPFRGGRNRSGFFALRGVLEGTCDGGRHMLVVGKDAGNVASGALMSEDPNPGHLREDDLESVVIRFCGDSGDGMQIAGGQFAATSAILGNDIATFPDFPAEIRAPRGTTFGVSGFQLHFASREVYTPGDEVNVLIAMNPAGLKVNLTDVVAGGIVIANSDEFNKVNLSKCGYPDGYNPLEDEQIKSSYQLFEVPMSRLTREALEGAEITTKEMDRCRNMFALGVAYWLYERDPTPTIQHLERYFGKVKGRPEIAHANIEVLRAGYHFGETAELFPARYRVAPAKLEAGEYRQISGNQAMVLGLATAAQKANKRLLYAGYPITPASDILHGLSRLKHLDVRTFQAEDEIAAVASAIGASFAGDLAVTGTSGPGLALKGEALGAAVIYELPLIAIDVQRAGPATGMPTKTEQADLFQALFGRSGESPCIVLAPSGPADCFNTAIEAARLAIRAMSPVIILSDGSIANGAEPWKIPDLDAIEPIACSHPAAREDDDPAFLPYTRNDETLARPWAIPGTKGLEHRLGSLEKSDGAGNVSYDPMNHQRMVEMRRAKIERVADLLPPTPIRGEPCGETLLLGWGGTFGAIATARDRLEKKGLSISAAHIRHLSPLPPDLPEIMMRFDRVIVPEQNMGQLAMLLRARTLVDIKSICHVRGRSIGVAELMRDIERVIEEDSAVRIGGAS